MSGVSLALPFVKLCETQCWRSARSPWASGFSGLKGTALVASLVRGAPGQARTFAWWALCPWPVSSRDEAVSFEGVFSSLDLEPFLLPLIFWCHCLYSGKSQGCSYLKISRVVKNMGFSVRQIGVQLPALLTVQLWASYSTSWVQFSHLENGDPSIPEGSGED